MLAVEGLRAGYGAVPVLRDVGFTVAAGEVVVIAGENGAGKSTLLKAVAGIIRPGAGRVLLDGRDLVGLSTDVIVARGLRLVLDGHQVFPELTVRDNLRLGSTARGGDRREFEADVEEMFGVFPLLREKFAARARDLSGGQQQMLALAQAFVVRPRVLLCDEPSTGIAMALMPPIMALLKRWTARGTAIVLVEQHLEHALGIADRAMLIERGELGPPCGPDEFRRRLGLHEAAA